MGSQHSTYVALLALQVHIVGTPCVGGERLFVLEQTASDDKSFMSARVHMSCRQLGVLDNRAGIDQRGPGAHEFRSPGQSRARRGMYQRKPGSQSSLYMDRSVSRDLATSTRRHLNTICARNFPCCLCSHRMYMFLAACKSCKCLYPHTLGTQPRALALMSLRRKP